MNFDLTLYRNFVNLSKKIFHIFSYSCESRQSPGDEINQDVPFSRFTDRTEIMFECIGNQIAEIHLGHNVRDMRLYKQTKKTPRTKATPVDYCRS